MSSDLYDYLFDLRGYLILENAVDAGHVAELNKALDEIPHMETGQWHGNIQRVDNNGHAGVELQNIVEAGEPFERLVDHPSWIDLLRRYCGEADSYVAGLFIDECFASIRRSGGFSAIHSGGYRGAMRGQYRYKDGVWRCGQVNILLPLTDVGPGDGGTVIIPGSHKSNLPHPGWAEAAGKPSDVLEGSVEVNLKAGDALLFVDGLSHGASARINPGERRVVIYRYGASWGSPRYGYYYSDELIARVTPAQRRVLRPIEPRTPPHANDRG